MRDDRLRLLDVRASIQRIREFMSGKSQPDLSNDRMLQSAVLYEFAVLGEAAGAVSSATTSKYPDVDWKGAKDLRNVVIHGYHKTDVSLVWDAVANDLPVLEQQIQRILNEQFPRKA